MHRIFCGLLLTALAGPAFAGPAGGPAGSPILNQSQRQIGATFNVSSGTIDDLYTKKVHFSDLTISSSAIGSGASNIILNQNVLQSGATFYVSSGTVAGNLRAGFFYGDGSNLTGISATLPTGSTSYIQNKVTLQSGATFYVSSGTVAGTLTAGTFSGGGSGLTAIPAANLTGSVPVASLSNAILNQSTLQSATFYVSSGTVNGQLTVTGNLFPQRLGYGTSTPASIIDLNGSASDPSPMARMGTTSNGDVLNLQANGLGTVLTAKNTGSGPSAVFTSNSTTIKAEGSTGDPILTLDDNNGSPGSAIKFSYGGTPYAQIGAGTDRSLSVLSSTDSTVSPTERVYFSNDPSTSGLVRFNTNNNGFNLAQSSLTFITGGTNPVLDWANAGKLRVSDVIVDVSTVNVRKAITFPDGTTQTTALTGGGASSIGVSLGGTVISSPTLNINFSSSVFTDTQSPAGTSNVGINSSSVTLQGNTFNTGSSSLVQLSGGLIPNSLLDSSSVTKMGSVFNSANKLLQLDSSGLIPNANIDGSSITKVGVLVAGSNITLTPGAGTMTIASSGGGGAGTVTNVNGGYGISTAVTGSTTTVNLLTNTSSYIQNTVTLQSGATFYVSSGTVDQSFQALNTGSSGLTPYGGLAQTVPKGFSVNNPSQFQTIVNGETSSASGKAPFNVIGVFGSGNSGRAINIQDLSVAPNRGTGSIEFNYNTSNSFTTIGTSLIRGYADNSGEHLLLEEGAHSDFNTLELNSSGATFSKPIFGDGSNLTGLIKDQSTLQSGAKFNVSSGTIQNYLTINGNPASDQSAVTRGYVGSRSQNLITNGSGLMGKNYNFSGFTFDPVETHGGGGSFLQNVPYSILVTDELLPVDTQKNYRMVIWGKSGEAGGADYNASNVQIVGVSAYDADQLNIEPLYYAKFAGSTDTTLAAQLNPGATTITLTNATGWYNGTVNAAINQMSWWPYTNAKGYSYPNYTYTRNTSYYIFSGGGYTYATDGLWSTGGISGNVMTLTHAWTGPTLPIGTPVRNASSGGTYKYITNLGSGAVPNDWTRYEGYIGGVDVNGTQDINKFPYGTAYLKPVFLINFHGAADNNIRWSDIWFSELSAVNLETASGTQIGVVIPGTQTLGGQKTIQAQASTDIPLILEGAASQSANLQAWTDSSGVSLSSVTASGAFSIRPRTKAQLILLAPEAKNLIYTCTDCTTDGLVISTGTSAGQFGRSSARTTAIQ